ncbi:hypothetical protein DSLPV1_024 [Dishui lake phycodnavirus 1]|uniref:hypothetical protein n=1 Tax=Dishui lake phycodnavirus 1 TaxID=2079134 RepID=UPI000CD681FF|nr:hypothetical protein C5Y57_gp024 [Dishui lake phycodnavirus 1]AUT18995.1 hypothetical protein DSLPV1_024 [Dishui lake phycodnavirus 1]
MSEIIETGNQIGQTIGLFRMLGGCCFASCLCSFGGMFLADKKQRKKNLPTAGALFCFACFVMMVSYLSYSVTKRYKGAGSIVALNAALGATGLGGIKWSI